MKRIINYLKWMNRRSWWYRRLILRYPQDTLYILRTTGLKAWLARGVYQLIMNLDPDLQRYRGETAPYCGHAYWGFTGRWIQEDNNEVGGEGYAKRFTRSIEQEY